MTLAQSSFAVVGGTGALGKLIAQELVAQGAKVVVLTRAADATVPEGTTAKVVDYNNESSVVAAFSGVEIVIMAVNHTALGIEVPVAKAAKQAGVKLFFPAEFGLASHTIPEDSLMYGKPKIAKAIDVIGLPRISIYTGFFSDQAFVPYIGFDIPGKKINIVGSDSVSVSFTTRPDIAKFVAYITTHISIDDLLKQAKAHHNSISVEGEKATWKQAKKYFDEVFGGDFELVIADADETHKSIAGDYSKFGLDIHLQASRGSADVGQNSNSLVPGFKPVGLKEALQKYY